MINIGVIGSSGRMGKEIVKSIVKNENTVLTGAVEIPGSSFIGQDAGEVAGIGKTGVQISDSLNSIIDSCDVIIDFTSPESTMNNLEIVKEKGKKIVIGTTALSEQQKMEVAEAAKEIAIVFSPNMSIGVNLLFNLTEIVTKIIGDKYDIEIIESHHNQKKDAPSGTAAKLADIIYKTLDYNPDASAVHGRSGITGKRKKTEVGIHAVRAGDIVGEHTILYAGPGERIELTHKAHSRETFANGAVSAAIFLGKELDSNSGLYTMHDVLKL